MPWGPAFIRNTSPTITYNFAFLQSSSPPISKIWQAGSVAPTVSKRSGCTPHPTALRKKCSKAHLPSKPRQLIRTCKGAGSPDRPLLAWGTQQPWVSKEGWKRDRGRTAGTVLSSEMPEAIVFTEYGIVVWQTHSSGAGWW